VTGTPTSDHDDDDHNNEPDDEKVGATLIFSHLEPESDEYEGSCRQKVEQDVEEGPAEGEVVEIAPGDLREQASHRSEVRGLADDQHQPGCREGQ